MTNNPEDGRKVIVVGGGLHGAAAMAALLAAGMSHPQTLVIEDDPWRDMDRMLDTLDVLSLFSSDDRPRDAMGFRHPHPPEPQSVRHIDTPKPVSKRRARRLRGKGL